jgi:hypothetical protein
MSAIDLTFQFVADAVTFVVSKVLGRAFVLDEKQTYLVGTYVVWGAIAIAAITVTLIYS